MVYRSAKKPSRSASSGRRSVLWLIGVLCVGLAILAVLRLTDTFPFQTAKQTAPTTANSQTKGEPTDQSIPQGGSTTPGSQDGTWSSDNKAPVSTPGIGEKPKPPECNFVSNHKPSLSSNAELQSNCVTTPGASCQIIFTQNGVVKSLPSKRTDVGGGVYWTWKLQDVGLTEGSWHIQAKATLGSESTTSEDALTLEVGP